MSDSPPRNRTLRRGVGARNLFGAKGRPNRRLMFAETAAVRPFNFRNSSMETRNASLNTMVPLVNGRNSRGRPSKISPANIRKRPEFANAMGTNRMALSASMKANRRTRNNDLKQLRDESLAPHRMLHLPVLNALREPGQRNARAVAKEGRHMVAQYEMGVSVPELNRLAAEGANNNYIAEEVKLLRRNYNTIVAHNEQLARNAAELNAQVAKRIAEEAGAREYPSRHKERKTRRNRK